MSISLFFVSWLSLLKSNINIINLSNRKLTEPEISLLTKGLKFTPVPKLGNEQEPTEYLNAFNRKLRLAEYFEGMEDEDISLVRNKSNFTPPDKRNGALDEFIDTVEKFPKTLRQTHTKQNLKRSEWKAVKSLKDDNSIIIKQADKGGASVIMNKETYKSMVERILNDEVYYTKLKTNPEKDLQMKYKRFLKNYKSHMTEKEMDYLQNFEAKTSNFYGLPKEHKSK